MQALDPRAVPVPALAAAKERYANAAEALADGNYPLALTDGLEGDAETRALATLMCGAVEPGLERLRRIEDRAPSSRLHEAFALWCLGRTEEGLAVLAGLAGLAGLADGPGRALAAAMGDAPLDVLVFSMPGSDKASAFARAQGFRVFPVSLEPERFGTSMAEILAELPPGAAPVLALSADAFGPYLPTGFHGTGIPTVLWAGDHDFFLATRHDDYAGATAIIANSASEHDEISAIHGVRVAAFPGHETYGWDDRFPEPSQGKTRDILFTGRAFVPYMRDKARFLFRIATLDAPDLEIELIDGYLEDGAYAGALASAKFVPLYWRYGGGIQTRAIDALRQGAFVFSPEAMGAGELLGGRAGGFLDVAPEDPEGEIRAAVDGYDDSRRRHMENRAGYGTAFKALFWPSPARESRFLKYCLFQTLLAPRREAPPAAAPRAFAAELRGYSVNQGTEVHGAIVKANLAVEPKGAVHMNFAALAAFYGAILVQDNQRMGEIALDLFRLGSEAHPRSAALRFNHARALWLFGRRDAARDAFRHLAAAPDLELDGRRDALLSHRVQALAEMFPYGDYYRSVVAGLRGGDDAFAEALDMIRAGAETYLGLDAQEAGDHARALALLRQAAGRSPVNFQTFRLLARSAARNGAEEGEALAAFHAALDLYPPVLADLLPIGVAEELARGREDAALELIRLWVRFQRRRRDGAGRLFAPQPESLAAALAQRHRLDDWTAKSLDLVRAAGEGA